MCPWCEEKEETLTHLLEDCNFAKEVWDTDGVWLQKCSIWMACLSESGQEFAEKDPLGGGGHQTTRIGMMIQTNKKFRKKDDSNQLREQMILGNQQEVRKKDDSNLDPKKRQLLARIIF